MAKKKKRVRGARRENRHERRKQQHTGGGNWDCIIIPEGVEVFKPKAKQTYNIDVLPYIVGGYNKNADKGDEYFELSYPCYNGLGIDEKRYIAIGELLGVRDPVAEHFMALKKRGAEWDEMKDFKTKWRQLMLIFVHEEADKGLQLFEGAYGTFGELLDEEISGEEEDYIDNFDDPDGGATLVVRFKAKDIGQSNKWVIASKINFEEREDGFDADGDEELAQKILDQVTEICLDDCLKICDYDTLKKALDGEPIVDSDGDVADDDDDGDDEPAKKTKAKKGKAKKTKPVEEPEFDDDDDDDDDGDEPEEKPAKKGKAKAKKAKAKKPKTAAELGIEKGADVEHDDLGPCSVLRIAKDGLTVTIMDEDGEIHKGINPADLTPMDEDEPEEKPAKKGKTKKSGARGADGKASKSKKAGAEDAGSDAPSDDWDDDWDDDDDIPF